jgi:hypothetical protein
LTSATWSGGISGSVEFGYDNDFRVNQITVNGANPVAYQYDADSLLTQAGDLTYTRDADNGLLTGSTLGSVNDSTTYNGFGEPTPISRPLQRHRSTEHRLHPATNWGGSPKRWKP